MSKQQSFQIGQIVYILSDEAETVIPAIIAEERIIKKLDGEKISWKIAIGPANKRKEMESDNIKGELYTSLNEIKSVMLVRLNDFVDKLITTAEKRTENWYGTNVLNTNNGNKIDPVLLSKEFDSMENEKLLPEQHKISQIKTKEDLKRELMAASVLNDDESNEEQNSLNENYVITDTGQKIPVKFNVNE